MAPSVASQAHADLSARELQVLEAIAGGCSNQEVADSLQISRETVKTHVRSILLKLQARDRTQAVVTALMAGLITLSPPGDDPMRKFQAGAVRNTGINEHAHKPAGS